MSLFKSGAGYTTKNFHIGSPEAEAETSFKSKIRLNEVFEDFLDIIPELNTEKFIVIGRKGSGKTALAEHLYDRQKRMPNYFCDFVKKIDIDIQKIVQVGKESGTEIQQELLFKWIILTKILKLISSNEAVQGLKGIKELKQFLKKNSGFVDIRGFEIIEMVRKQGFEVNVEYFKRFASKFNQDFTIRGEKAPFYKLLPHLEDAIITILSSNEDAENEYTIIFDDLDIGFKAANIEHVNTLINLIRIAKDYNISCFGKNSINVKIIILLRDDIASTLRQVDSDTAKIFTSYSILISWYEHEVYKKNENLLKIKRFINKRIEKNFSQNNVPLFSEKGAWSSLIQEDTTYYKESSFKYVIEHTFYKPRDFILFFLPLSKYELNIPLDPNNVKMLLGLYSKEAVDEINNELLAFLDSSDIKKVYELLEYFIKEECFTYESLLDKIFQLKILFKADELIELLFNYSLIGNKDVINKVVYFKNREERSNEIMLNKELHFVIHYIIKIYMKNKRTPGSMD